jgi:preprotein translocase subunit SecG
LRRPASDWIDFMQTVVIVIHLMIVVAMIGLVLLQRSEGGGLGMGGGGGGFMSSRGTANVLTRATAILAGVFFVTSMILSVLAGHERKPRSILQTPGSTTTQPVAPGAPGAPAPLGTGKGVFEQLQKGAPAEPQIPRP